MALPLCIIFTVYLLFIYYLLLFIIKLTYLKEWQMSSVHFIYYSVHSPYVCNSQGWVMLQPGRQWDLSCIGIPTSGLGNWELESAGLPECAFPGSCLKGRGALAQDAGVRCALWQKLTAVFGLGLSSVCLTYLKC